MTGYPHKRHQAVQTEPVSVDRVAQMAQVSGPPSI
jgi:hypothetical protein